MTQTSPFAEGTEIVVVHTSNCGDRSFNPAVVTKVTPTGRFRIKYAHGHEPDRQYKPEFVSYANGGKGRWHGNEIGGSKYSRDHVEVFDDEVKAQMAELELRRDAATLKHEIEKRVSELNARSEVDRVVIDALADLLGIELKKGE